MIVSINTYYIICGIIVACGVLPTAYNHFISKRPNIFAYSWVLVLLTAPLNWFTPAVYNVTDCGEYTKNILLLPKGDYSLGRHNYIVNESENTLYFEYITYGKVSPDEVGEDQYIEAGETGEIPVVHINFLFREPDNSIRLKSDGAVRTRLSCDIPDYEEDDEGDYIEEDEDLIVVD